MQKKADKQRNRESKMDIEEEEEWRWSSFLFVETFAIKIRIIFVNGCSRQVNTMKYAMK